jgi:hypothetical protein
MTDFEVWSALPGHRDYAVSNLGRVKRVTPACGTRVGRILMPVLRNGYPSVLLRDSANGKRLGVYIHQAVCTAFHGEKPSALHQVRHLDGDQTNAASSNLAWGLPKENTADKVRHGTQPYGEQIHNAKLSWELVDDLRAAYAATKKDRRGRVPLGWAKEQAARLGVAPLTITHVCRGWKWRGLPTQERTA